MRKGTVLITGSSKGLGEELALVFASNGYEIVLHGRDEMGLARVKEKVLEKGVGCYLSAGDLRSDEVIEQLFDVAKEREITVLINNAAMPCPGLPFEEISCEEIDSILTTNLTAPIKLTRKIYSFFLEKGSGTIININSISGLENQELRSAYCASKWGLRGFTDTLRVEAKKHNIRVIGVYPSRIQTKPHFRHGMKAQDVAQNIFDIYERTSDDEIILDNRLEKLKRGKE